MPTVAVMMPFSNQPPNNVREHLGLSADQFYNSVIQPAIEQVNTKRGQIELIHAAQLGHNDNFMNKVCYHLFTADVVIADLTGNNPNVLYELGIRHTIGLSTVILAPSATDIPSNLRAHQVPIRYIDPGPDDPNDDETGEPRDLAKRIERVRSTITEIVEDCLNNGAFRSNPVMEFLIHHAGGSDERPPWPTQIRCYGILDEDRLRSQYNIERLDSWLDPSPNSEVFIVGRSNVQWAKYFDNTLNGYLPDGFEQVKFSFLLTDPDADMSLLPFIERSELKRDLEYARRIFQGLAARYRQKVDVRFLPWVLLDSFSFYTMKGGRNVLHWDVHCSKRHIVEFSSDKKDRVVIQIATGVPSQDEVYRIVRARAKELFDRAA